MTGTRFARTGRCRFFVCLAVLTVMLCMVAIFHSSQQQLDEAREQRLRCERQQEQLNEQLQGLAEQKYNQQKTLEQERNEQMEARRNVEQQLKEQNILRTNEQMNERVRYDKLQQTHKLLKSEHNELVAECQKSKKELLESTNALEKKLQSLRSEAEKEKNVLNADITLWREKYNAIVAEKERLEILLDVSGAKFELQNRIIHLESTVAEYQQHCDYKPEAIIQNENAPNSIRKPSSQPHIEKFFSEQVRVSPGLYHIDIKLTNKTQNISSPLANQSISATNNPKIASNSHADGDNSKASETENVILKAGSDIVAGGVGVDGVGGFLPYLSRNNRSLILNSVENFQILPKTIGKIVEGGESDANVLAQIRQPPANQLAASVGSKQISPLSPPRKAATTEASKSEQHVLEANAPVKQTNSSSTASSGLPPLPMPPNPRKLPENVAPIPANFDDLLKEDRTGQKVDLAKEADVDAAEEVQKNDNDEANNNRYANAINDMEPKASKKDAVIAGVNAANEDSGAHEIKDNDFMNDQNFNLPANEDNFFDGGGKNGAARNAAEKPKVDDNDDEEGLAGAVDAGDIAVKNQNLLDTNNLHNEVAGDQGKEFPDELRLEENNEEDEDEDDYSNPAARQQGEQAIRN